MNSSTLFSLFIIAAVLGSASAARYPGRDFIATSCKVTRYPDVCVSSLSPYAASLQGKPSQSELVKAALKVSLVKTQNVTAWAVTLAKTRKGLGNRERSALKDCVENFGDSLGQIRQSLAELKHLMPGTFKFQMSNVQTWMSAALTNEDSCLNGFQGIGNEKVKVLVNGQVQDSSQLISNALALINRFATSRGY